MYPLTGPLLRFGRNLLTVPVLVATAVACAPSFTSPMAPGREEIPRLEARVAADSGDAQRLFELAAAYKEAERVSEAVALLERAATIRPSDAGVALYLGLAYEDLDRHAEARDAYARFLELGGPPATERHVRGRLKLLERQGLVLAIRESLAQEAELAATQPQPRTVAIFPFLSGAEDEQLEPLSRALADLLVRDLSQTDRMTVLERARVQLLLDELELAEEGLVEPTTAARGGHLLGASNIVQGSIHGQEEALQLEATIVTVGGESGGRVSPLSEEDALDRLFDMKTRLSLQIYQSLGIELTVAERERIEQQPTRNLLALIEFGLGLAADDAGSFATAANHFNAAVAIDPGFEAARLGAAEAEEAADAETASTDDVARVTMEELTLISSRLDRLDELVPPALDRDAASEVLGREGFGSRGAVIEVIIRRR